MRGNTKVVKGITKVVSKSIVAVYINAVVVQNFAVVT
jgi:hypothetical protein